MAVLFQCDRCKDISHSRCDHAVEVNGERSRDLCDDCARAFERFMQGTAVPAVPPRAIGATP